MIPELVELAELPRTHNGKLDRQRLAAPPHHAQAVKEADEPRGPVERKLAEIFCQVLAVPRVSRRASFAELGGDSILSLRVIARTRKAGLAVTLPQLVRSESLAALAACIEPAQPTPPPEPATVDPSLMAADAEQQEHPLSYEQERLWFLWKLEPHSSVYNIAAALRLTGELDTNALVRAFARLVARHEALRTAFVERDGQPIAVVRPIASAASASHGPHLHLETSPTLTAANAALDAWAREPFDLAVGQPFRWRLIRLSPTDHVLGIALHHAVADGWSLNLLMSELPRVYTAERHAQPLSLPPLARGYGQYARWQRAMLSGERRQRLLDYWQQQLGSEHAPIELPFDRPRRATRAHAQSERRAGASVLLRLHPELIARARSVAHLERTSLFAVLLTCLDVLLAHDSGQRDVRVGLGMANRPRVDSEDVVGFFVQTLVHRARLTDRVSFRALLAQVSDTLLAAQEHADLPFSQLVATLAPERSDSHDPLVQVFYNHQKRASSALDLPDLRVERLELSTTTAQFELGLYTEEDDHGALQGRFVYATRLFDASSAARLARRFERLLDELVATPDLAVDDATCSGAEDARLLAHVNATAQDYTKSPLVPTRINARLRELGSRPALCFGADVLSGLELDARAKLLAQRLQASGVGPDVLVGVCLARSLELVVAVLGVLKAGGAYLPLEPELPDERLAQMLQLAGPRVVLTSSTDAPRFATWHDQPTGPARTLLAVDRQPYAAELARTEFSEPALHGENLAYVIFTSGSTGRPKAVASRHAGLLNRLQWMQTAYALDETDVVLHKTPFGFDVSVWELLWPLLQGARLVVAAPGAHKDPLALTQTITQQAVTTLHFVPSMLAAFLEHPSSAQCRSLRRIVCSGEALPPAVATRTLEQLPAAALYNLYGPTEASIDVTHWTCRAHDEVVPIGAPIANTSVHVLDAQLAPVPIGVAGELYLAGVGLARGYHAAPGLTAERFVPHETVPGARMYRTGDRVRLRADGALEYLGRNDGQIKLRGVRIELGEIEAALSACPGVRRAAVALHAGAHLVGYVVGEGLEPAQLRAQLARALPDAYVPTQIVVLPELPLTPSGKLDRKALPAPALEPTCFIAPEPGLQSQLALLWAELLQVERVGRDDDFFALGGHSLLAARLLARLEGELGVQVPLQRLFAATRLSAFAALVEETRTQSSGATQRMAAWLDELEAE
jgi:amino acid adenylation domain-containing protein